MTFFQISRNINFYKNQIVLQFNLTPETQSNYFTFFYKIHLEK